ncbi:MAG: hypothetical protein IJU80_03650 [Lachnospiraceae bacterium]|nr:hypothetical protein [Lachnospiraceae bacterium]
MAQKITCPVCFTKMNEVGHDLVCPVCGYKYCEGHAPYTYDDHNHNAYKSYNEKTTYSTGYTTAGQGSSASQSSYTSAQGSYQANSKNTSYSQGGNATRQTAQTSAQRQTSRKPKKPKGVRLIFFIVFLYFALTIFSIFWRSISENCDKEELISFFEEYFSSDTSNQKKEEAKNTKSSASADSEGLTMEEILDYFHTLEAPETLFQDLLCTVSHKPVNQITREDCESVTDIQVYFDDNDQVCLYYRLTDGTGDDYRPANTTFDTSELRLFTNLEQFRAYSITNMFFHPGDFRGLNHLNCLECSNTPAQICELLEDPEQLQYLILNSKELAFDLTDIEKFQNLYVLEVYSIGVDNADGIGQITGLTDFTMDTTTKPSDFSFLCSLVNMEYLEIETRHLTDVSFLEYMPNLFHLSISGAIDLTDISAIRSCQSMTELSLKTVTSLQDFSPIGALGNLDTLNIDDCGLKDISFMSSLKNLIYVSLTYNEITDLSPLEALPLLSDVYVYGNSIENYGTLDRSILYE